MSTTEIDYSEFNIARVKWFSNKKGFGYITDLKSKKDIFVHHSGIKTTEQVYRTLVEGEYISYSTTTDNKNQVIAIDVTGVFGHPLLCENKDKKILVISKDSRNDSRNNSKNTETQ